MEEKYNELYRKHEFKGQAFIKVTFHMKATGMGNLLS